MACELHHSENQTKWGTVFSLQSSHVQDQMLEPWSARYSGKVQKSNVAPSGFKLMLPKGLLCLQNLTCSRCLTFGRHADTQCWVQAGLAGHVKAQKLAKIPYFCGSYRPPGTWVPAPWECWASCSPVQQSAERRGDSEPLLFQSSTLTCYSPSSTSFYHLKET